MDQSQVEDLYGTYPETAVTNVLVILNLVAEGFRGGFDFGPTIQRIELILPNMPTEYETQNRQVLAGLKAANSRQHAAVDAQDHAAVVACSIVGRRNRAQLMNASSLGKALQAGSDGDKVLALFKLSNFFANLRVNEEYRQADLQDQPSLGPLVAHALRLLEPWTGGILEDDIPAVTTCFILSEHAKTVLSQLSSPSKVPPQALVKNLETIGGRLLALLKAHTSDLSVSRGLFLGLSAVGQCANATWASKAAMLGNEGLLCKEWFPAAGQHLSVEETEDFTDCLLKPLKVPSYGKPLPSDAETKALVREALLKDGMLTWIFEMAAKCAGAKIMLRPNLLPLLTLCSELGIEPSGFVSGEELSLFVKQMVRNWRGFKSVTLPTFEEEGIMIRVQAEELSRLAGHVYIVREVLCKTGSEKGNARLATEPVSGGEESMSAGELSAFCQPDGVTVFADVLAQRDRLRRFHQRAEKDGYSVPDSAELLRGVMSVWEVAAKAFNLKKCSSKVRSTVSNPILRTK